MALLGVCATLIAGTVAPESRVAQQLAYFLILFVLIIPVHELGHAVAGGLVGFRIMSIVVGSGPPLGAFRGLGVNFQINLLPLGGMTLGFARRAHGWMRLRQWIFTAGGPAANVLIYVVLKRLFGPTASDAEHHPIVATAIVVNWSILVANLIPFRMSEGMRSDGYGLFTIPFWSGKQVEEAQMVHAGVRAQDALNRHDLPGARQFAEEARLRFPNSPMPDTLIGAVQHRQRQHDEALATWRAALLKTTDPKQQALLKNNIAFAALVRGHAEDLPEAERLSGEAIAVLPELAPVSGTRGAVLLRLGRAAEALPLLTLGEAGATGSRNQAYTKALMASTLAALGRGEEARRKLAEARLAEPDCELLPRAEADLAAGPLAAPPAAAAPGESAPPDAGTRSLMLRHWRRDARILAFVTGFVVLERLGFAIAPGVLVIVMSIAPEMSGAIALGAYGLSAAAMHALGLVPPDHFGAASPSGAAPLALAAGVAACWLIARHQRLGPQPPTRTPIVLGWILAGMAILSLLPDLIRLSWERSPIALHGRAHEHLSQIPGLIALAALLASRRHRAGRPLALLPVALAVLSLVIGSSWYLNRFVLADVAAAQGPAVTWAAPIPAKVAREVHFSGPGGEPAVSPGGRAFFIKNAVRRAARDGGTSGPESLLRVGDFDGHLVEIAGTAGAFIDDQRLLVLRRGLGPRGASQLVEVRPFARDRSRCGRRKLPTSASTTPRSASIGPPARSSSRATSGMTHRSSFEPRSAPTRPSSRTRCTTAGATGRSPSRCRPKTGAASWSRGDRARRQRCGGGPATASAASPRDCRWIASILRPARRCCGA